MPLTRFTVGQRIRGIPVHTWNAFADSAERRRERDRDPPLPGDASLQPIAINNTTADLAAGSVLGINDVLNSDPSDIGQGIVIDGVTPSASHYVNHCVLEEDTAMGDAGLVLMSGMAWLLVNLTDTGHTFAKISPGQIYFTSAMGGAHRIIKKPSSVQLGWCLVHMFWPGEQFWKGKANTSIAPNTDPTANNVRLYNGDGTTTNEDVTAEFDWCATNQDAIGANHELFAKYLPVHDKWVIVGRECISPTGSSAGEDITLRDGSEVTDRGSVKVTRRTLVPPLGP